MKQLLQTTLHHEIPLTRAIGIEVEKASTDSVTLTAPLENNINHKSTAFGGSLYSVAVLAGWSMIFMRLDAAGIKAHIVIQESNIEYLHPIANDIRAKCSIDSEDRFQKFINIFKRKGVARIMLQSIIEDDQGVAVSFEGRYVIHT